MPDRSLTITETWLKIPPKGAEAKVVAGVATKVDTQEVLAMGEAKAEAEAEDVEEVMKIALM